MFKKCCYNASVKKNIAIDEKQISFSSTLALYVTQNNLTKHLQVLNDYSKLLIALSAHKHWLNFEEALKEWQELRIAQSSERMEGIQTYSQLLQEISKGHQQLYDQRNDLNPQVLRQLQKSVEEMRELLALVKNI